MDKAEQYAKKYLTREVTEIENSPRFTYMSELSVYEKAIILKYTDDGYEDLNEHLRRSKVLRKNDFGDVLDYSLSKVDNFKGLVYRCVTLTESELSVYVKAFDTGKPVVENAFLSTSKSKALAYEFGKNTIFRIYSRTGKDIEKIAKFGIDHPQNEREVLFRPGRSFNILDITKEGSYTLIIMEERK